MESNTPYRAPRVTILNEDDTLEVERFRTWMLDVKKYSPVTTRYMVSTLKTLIYHKVNFDDNPRDIYYQIYKKFPTRNCRCKVAHTINTYKWFKQNDN